jgi:Sigma-70 region 2.
MTTFSSLSQETLSSEQLYRRELTSLLDAKDVSQQEKDRDVARARAGDLESRERIITQLLHRVASYAGMYYATYSWVAPHIAYMDLVQAGNIAILENIDHVLQSEHTCPHAYLTVTAYRAIRLYFKRYSSLVVTPYTAEVTPMHIDSLDAPLKRNEGDGTLYDLVADELEDTINDEADSRETIDYTPLYDALDTLGPAQHTVVVHYYGLFETDPKELKEIDQHILKREGASGARSNALDRLHQRLARAYPQFCSSGIRPRLKRPAEISDIALTPEQRARLEQAHAAILQRGETLTQDRLRIEAHMDSCHARKSYVNSKQNIRKRRLSNGWIASTTS